jgi:CubicO group peptidase (beta-lactamase class C family)
MKVCATPSALGVDSSPLYFAVLQKTTYDREAMNVREHFSTKSGSGSSSYPLPPGEAANLGISLECMAHLDALIEQHIAEGRYAGAQIALARHGQLVISKNFGMTGHDPDGKLEEKQVDDRSLFTMRSQTKVFTSAAVWTLVEEGKVSFMDRVADLLPEFAVNGKGAITLHQVMTHRGGFPSANVTEATWTDHTLMRNEVCAFSLEWTPATRLQYHARAAHLVQAMIIEAVTGRDYRDAIRERVMEPLGIADDVFIGVPENVDARCTFTGGGGHTSREYRAAGIPSSGGYGTARGLVAFYQMMLGGAQPAQGVSPGTLHGRRLLSPRLVGYVSRNHTGDMPDHGMGGIPMHRGLGLHMRGDSDVVRGLGTLAAPDTFGHGGAGTCYSWADPSSGVSFAYLTNHVVPDPWHSLRMDRVSNIVHAAID